MLTALSNGTPIEGVRTRDEMLALAGACFYAAMSHGPDLHQGRDRDKAPVDYREATEPGFYRDLHGAVEFYAQVAMMIRLGEYDNRFEPEARAILHAGAEGDGGQVVPLQGFKDQ